MGRESLSRAVSWKFVYFPDLSTAIRAGFAVAEGYWSIGYDGSGKAVTAKKLYPDTLEEMDLFLDKDTEALQKIYDASVNS